MSTFISNSCNRCSGRFFCPKTPPTSPLPHLSQTGGNLGATGKVWERFPRRDWGRIPLTPTAAMPQIPQNSNSAQPRPVLASRRFGRKAKFWQIPTSRCSGLPNRRFLPKKCAELRHSALVPRPNRAAPAPPVFRDETRGCSLKIPPFFFNCLIWFCFGTAALPALQFPPPSPHSQLGKVGIFLPGLGGDNRAWLGAFPRQRREDFPWITSPGSLLLDGFPG